MLTLECNGLPRPLLVACHCSAAARQGVLYPSAPKVGKPFNSVRPGDVFFWQASSVYATIFVMNQKPSEKLAS